METFDDFWRMMWEQMCSVIIMLTKLEERGRVSKDNSRNENDNNITLCASMISVYLLYHAMLWFLLFSGSVTSTGLNVVQESTVKFKWLWKKLLTCPTTLWEKWWCLINWYDDIFLIRIRFNSLSIFSRKHTRKSTLAIERGVLS